MHGLSVPCQSQYACAGITYYCSNTQERHRYWLSWPVAATTALRLQLIARLSFLHSVMENDPVVKHCYNIITKTVSAGTGHIDTQRPTIWAHGTLWPAACSKITLSWRYSSTLEYDTVQSGDISEAHFTAMLQNWRVIQQTESVFTLSFRLPFS
jgi:hypothetical protein